MKRYLAVGVAVFGSLLASWAASTSMEQKWVLMLTGTVDQALAAKSRLIAAGPKAVPALIEGFGSWDEVKRVQCAETVAAIREPALPALEKALRNDAPRVRLSAILALDEMNDAAATRLIASASYDTDWWVRTNVALALRDTTVQEGIDALNDLALNDSDSRVRYQAAQIMAQRSLSMGR